MQSTFVLAQLEALPLPEDNLKKAAAAVEKAVKLYHPDFMVFPEVFMSHYPAGTDRPGCWRAVRWTICKRNAETCEGKPDLDGFRNA
jgi:predicted amidohydrolase